MLIAQWKEANDRSDTFVDHSGTVRDARTGKAIEELPEDDDEPSNQLSKWSSVDDIENDTNDLSIFVVGGFGFYDAGVDVISTQRNRRHFVGKVLSTKEY